MFPTRRRKIQLREEYDLKPRRSIRQVLDGPVTGLSAQQITVEAKVHNVSACGFMVECARPLQIGSFVSLELPGIGAVDAQVRWQIGDRMGGMFLDPVSLAHCDWTAAQPE